MDYEQKYTEDSSWDMEDDFKDFFLSIDPFLAHKIAKFLDENLQRVPSNKYITHIRGGVVKHEDEQVYFAVEITKLPGFVMTLSFITFIDVDEYLDLINLNCYIKSNHESNRKLNKPNSFSIQH